MPGSKTAALYKKEINMLHIKEYLNRTNPPKLLEERFMVEMNAFIFQPFHFLFEVFDRKLQQYVEAGLVDYNLKEFHQKSDLKKFEVLEEPFAVLTLTELEAGFVVCITPLVLSVFVFSFEWLPTIKDFLVLWTIFKKYFSMKKME